nr:MAG TPA: hypothetical protein [Caudoviricetes sp.]DAN64075.1 MAG TPA: hypothetical protein [Caudoviricetes sp.]
MGFNRTAAGGCTVSKPLIPPHTRGRLRLARCNWSGTQITTQQKPLVLQRMVRLCNRLHQPAPVHPRRIGGYH